MRISDWSSDVCSSDLGLSHADFALAHPLGQPGAAVLAGVPFVHAGQDFVAVMDRDHRAFGQGVEVTVGDDGDRKSVVKGKSVSVRVELGGRRIIKTTNNNNSKDTSTQMVTQTR